jgi:chromosome partitioning protein
MQILAIINQKGGVAKTTTAINLAALLARENHNTLLVDMDAQGNVGDALGVPKRGGLYQLLIDKAGSSAITPSGRPNLDLILSDKSTVEAGLRLSTQPFGVQALARALDDLDSYDVAILDVAPGLDLFQASALVAATAFLIPVKLDHLAVVGANEALRSALALQEEGGFSGQFLGVLPTFFERTTKESLTQLRVLHKAFNALTWPPIPSDTKAREAPAHGETLIEYEPGCRALSGISLNGSGVIAGGYHQVLARLIKELEL